MGERAGMHGRWRVRGGIEKEQGKGESVGGRERWRVRGESEGEKVESEGREWRK